MCADFDNWCESIGIADEVLRPIATNDSDVVSDIVDVDILPSDIDGYGVFATKEYSAGDFICFSRVGGRTLAGRYVNHSANPNAEFVGDFSLQSLVARVAIKRGEEITINYRSPGVLNT
jgi:SET domain-containing protein